VPVKSLCGDVAGTTEGSLRCSCSNLEDELTAAGIPTHLVGGADVAAELDAKRAIDQATRLALVLETAKGKVRGADVHH